MPIERIRLRQAMKLEQVWSRQRLPFDDSDAHWDSITRSWQAVQTLRPRIAQTDQRCWVEARASVVHDLRWRIDELTRKLQELRPPEHIGPPSPPLRDWLYELQALGDEFRTVEFKSRLMIVRVTIESVTLLGVELGRFAIELHLDRLTHQRGASCFEIVAVEPNPATGRDDVVHPHVNDGALCAGDASRPVERALAAGRLSDAFLLIRSVLTTYNRNSAYVQLELWEGENCQDCGGRMDSEQSNCCESCHRDYCDGCMALCGSCEESRCTGCLEECAGCQASRCGRCLETIDHQLFCPDCRDVCNGCEAVQPVSVLDDDQLCPNCQPAVPEPDPSPEESIHALPS